MSKASTPFEELFFSRTMDYLEVYLPRQASRSGYTQKAYKQSIGCFYDYITQVLGLSPLSLRYAECTYKLVLGFSQYMQEKLHYGPSTVNQRLAAVKSYLKYVSDGDISLMQIYLSVKKVPELSVPKVQRPIIEKEDLPAFLDSPNSSRIGNRDRMMLILLFDTAIRVSELVSITLGDILIDTENPVILIHGKGRKERAIAVSDRAATHLKAYITAYHKDHTEPVRPLFFTIIHGKMNHMSVRNVERIVNKYGEIVRENNPRIPESTYPHLVRRTRATGLYRDGIPLEMISTLLGHSHSETTKLYASASVEQLRDAMKKGQENEPSEAPLWKGHEEEMKKKFGLR